MFDCAALKELDLSRNNFNGVIPLDFDKLKNLQKLKLHENRLTGSIPSKISQSKDLQELMLQSNLLTGNIPVGLGTLDNVTIITLNHNKLKGSIPGELDKLQKLKTLHLHQNDLTGLAPNINLTVTGSTYITDCGEPSFLLEEIVRCTSCTMCCNSNGFCQEISDLNMWVRIITILVIPVGLFLLWKVIGMKERDPLEIYSDDSVYCFLLTKNWFAWVLHLLTLGLQLFLYQRFLGASNVRSEDTDWNFTFVCPGNDIECEDEKDVSIQGWFSLFIVTFTYLGEDFLKSLYQLHAAAILTDAQIFVSGFLLFSITGIAFFASIVYNMALAETDTELIMNAVILLFISDMDEQVFSILSVLAPEWTSTQTDCVAQNMISKSSNLTPSTPITEEIEEK